MLQQKVLRGVFKDPDTPACWLYRAQAGDTLDDIATATGIPVNQLKDDNKANILDFSELEGRFIKLYNIQRKPYCWTAGHNGALIARRFVRCTLLTASQLLSPTVTSGQDMN